MNEPEAAQPLPNLAMEIGQLLRAARAKAGMTRKQLAHASGASERYLAMIETGTGNPTLNVMVALALALDMPLADLLPLGGERDGRIARLTGVVRKMSGDTLSALDAWLSRSPDVYRSAKAGRIVLIGLRGAGKTTLGQKLAARLGVPFLEISKMVEDLYGGNIGLLIEIIGQAGLRRYESQAWDDICQTYDRAVIAAPGGIVADAPLYERMLSSAHSVWLQASPEDHMARVMAQGDFRPMASNRGAMKDLKAIIEARSADYARASLHLNTSGLSLDEALDRLEASMAGIQQQNL